MALLLFLAGCKDETPGYVNGGGDYDGEMGYLITSGLSVSVVNDELISSNEGLVNLSKSDVQAQGATDDDDETPSLIDASEDYRVSITNEKTSEALNYTYGDLKKAENQRIPLEPGSYVIAAESPDYADYMAGSNYAGWECPVFAGSVTKTIVKETETTVEDLICSLANIKTTVTLTADLQDMFLPDAQATDELPSLKVTLSIGDNALVFNRAESDNESRGYFKAVELSNTIHVKLEGAYNQSAADADPVYTPVKWERDITDCRAGQWRKISITVLNSTEGNVQFQMTVENWVYDDKIDVDAMQLLASVTEETIDDIDISDVDSPVVTLDGRDITQGYTISGDMFDSELGKWSDNIKAIITPQSGYTIRNVKVVFSSDNAQLMSALGSAGYTNGTVSIWPESDNLLTYLLIKEDASSGVLTVTVRDVGMSGLFAYEGTHNVKFIVTDSKGRISYTNLTIWVIEGGIVGSGPEIKWTNSAGTISYDFDQRYTITGTATDPEVKITVTSQTGITGFVVEINSATLTADELAGLGLSTTLDLVNPGIYETPLNSLGFPTGSDVAGKTTISFDISSFMSLLAILGPGNSDFKLTVTDATGSTTKTLQLYVP